MELVDIIKIIFAVIGTGVSWAGSLYVILVFGLSHGFTAPTKKEYIGFFSAITVGLIAFPWFFWWLALKP